MPRLLLPLSLLCALTMTVSAHAATVSVRVSFSVANVNRSTLACPTDGRRYTVRGHLVGPAAGLRRPEAATLYLHGLGFGEFFWDYSHRKGYNYARELADAGQTSVVIDRLGYGASGKPPGAQSCLGGQADIAHQIVTQLKSGRYTASGVRRFSGHSAAPRFRELALAGHSAGGLTAQLEASSFGGIDALIVMGFEDQETTMAAAKAASDAAAVCAVGGRPVDGSPGYVFFGQTDTEARVGFFSPFADLPLVDAIVARRSMDPCGDAATLTSGVPTDAANLHKIKVPVLLVFGNNDALYDVAGSAHQAARFTGARLVTRVVLPHSGHAVTLDADHRLLQTTVARWLSVRGL